jgi:hypothetical protein
MAVQSFDQSDYVKIRVIHGKNNMVFVGDAQSPIN